MINDIIDKLNLDKYPVEKIDGKNCYVLKDSNDFSRMYTKLDNMEELELKESDLALEEQSSLLIYQGEDCIIRLLGNFVNDEYLVNVESI